MLRIVMLLLLTAQAAGSDLYRKLAVAANKGNNERLCSLLSQVGPKPEAKLVKLLLQLGVQTPSAKVYRSVREAFSNIKSKQSLKLLEKALRQKQNFKVRSLALFALGDIRLAETVRILSKFLKDSDPRIRIQAAKTLGKKRFRESVTSLLDILPAADKAGGEFRAAVRRSLYKLTRKAFTSPEDWKKWWAIHKDQWDGSAWEPSGRTAVKGVKPPGKTPRFFGIEILSLRVVFVIDVSGSMKEQAENYDMSRMELVKKELIRTIKDLKKRARFTVVTFSNKIQAYSKRLLPATRANKVKATRFVRSLNADGTTWTQEALEKAFSFKQANTIVLLSDGSPCKGNGVLPTKPILEWVERTNRFRKATINCVGFPMSNIPFMRSLALENGGKYKHARIVKEEQE